MALTIQFQKNFTNDYTYSDLALDMEREYVPYGESNLTRKSGNSDVRTDFDEYAIANSLRNLFSTRPKQRLLDPEYGLDLSQFLFEHANEYTARLIARKIDQGVRRYEPRVRINVVEVIVDEENNSYDISLNLTIPSLKKDVVYRSVFTENGFTNI